MYFGVRGESVNVQGWAKRIGATQVTKADIQAAIDAEAPAEQMCDMGFTHAYKKPVAEDTV